MGIVEYAGRPDRKRLAPLFAGHKRLRTMVDAVLQGYCGTALADDSSNAAVAQLAIQPFTFLAGDATHPVARTLVERLPAESCILLVEKGWRDLVSQAHGERIKLQPRTSFSCESLNLTHVRALASHAPDGFRVERVDVDLAQRIRAEVSPHLLIWEAFGTPEDFVERGIGFCAMADDRMVCGATSAVVCDGAIEIQVNTNEPCRGRGLATAVSAALIAHCLERGIEPHWDTRDPASERVARKLGYTVDGTYEWLVVTQ